MAQAHVDPEKLRSFALQLKHFAAAVENGVGGLRNGMGRLRETWKDQEYETFARQFVSTQELLKRLVQEIRKTAPLLERDAAAIEEYLRYRL